MPKTDAVDHVVARRLAELRVGRGDVEDVVDDLEHHRVRVAVFGERLDRRAVVATDDPADAGGRSVERGRLAVDRGEVALPRPGDVVGVAKFFDLPLAQPTDRARQQARHLGAERGSDLRRARQQEVAGENRLQVPPLRIDRLDASPRLGLVHHVVVVQRAEVHELAGHATAHGVVARSSVVDTSSDHGQCRTKTLSTGDDQVGRDLGEVVVRRDDGGEHRGLDALAIDVHAVDGEQRG